MMRDKAKVKEFVPSKAASAGDYTDIATIRATVVSYSFLGIQPVEITIDAAVTGLAGIDGPVKWDAVASEIYKNNPAVYCVLATVDIPPDIKKKVKVRFFRNRNTEAVQLDSLTVNGKKSTNSAFELMYGLH